MKFLHRITIMLFVLLMGLSVVSAHGVDVTSDKMVIANDTNGQQIKDIADSNNINISVYKFTSEDEVAHQLEHMLNNSNKYIIVVAYQNVAQEFLKNHNDVSDRLIILDDFDNQTIKNKMEEISNQNNISNDNSSNWLLLSGIVILALLAVGFVLITKNKK